MARAPVRVRDAAATKAAILASARRAFARAGYDGAGLREIAAGAGVTAMLVNRYFGSKQKLFAEVAAETMREAVILTPANLAAPDVAAALAEALVRVTAPAASPLDGFRILLHSASSPHAARIGRDWIRRGHQSTLEAFVRGDLAQERAALFLALVAGLQAMRQMFTVPALADASPAALQRLLEPLLRELLVLPPPVLPAGAPAGANDREEGRTATRRAKAPARHARASAPAPTPAPVPRATPRKRR